MSNALMSALFQQQRFQIMHLGVHHNEFTDAYLYAWYEGVYPYVEDTDGSVIQMPHELYQDHFRYKKDRVDELHGLLDQKWSDKNNPTFYELEKETGWERPELLSLCRYFFLQFGSFDEDFWNKLVEPMQHPSEAQGVVKPFDRQKDIYFM